MDKDERSTGLTGLVMLALVAAGAFIVARPALDSSRPAAADAPATRPAADRGVDARLWQDPLGAVARAREQARKAAGVVPRLQPTQDEAWFRQHLARALAPGPAPVAVAGGPPVAPRVGVMLAVLLPGGPHAEQAESRRRMRFAVLAGLSARGLVPSDGEHLSYFDARLVPGTDETTTVVFESVEAEHGARDRPDDCDSCRVFVLWLDSAAFADKPLARLLELAERTAARTSDDRDRRESEATAPPRWRVLGPPSSGELRALVREAGLSRDLKSRLARFDMRFYSPLASAPDAVLLSASAAPADESVSAYLARRGVPLLRTTGTDDGLARALVRELELRGLRARPSSGRVAQCPRDDSGAERHPPQDLPSSVAIVSEWDNLYGRSLRRQFRYEPKEDKPGFCVTRWHYLRGLDGRLGGEGAAGASPTPGAPKKEPRTPGEEAPPLDRGVVERPEGHSQLDYLRRLAIQMRLEDARLRRVYGREYGIRAIGVLGNDVYDKLLVLQALQAELPHAIFFTTDLDARLLHPRERAWARNLIVASNYGLQLAEPLQRGYAPFRDSQQSAAYLATLLAMSDVGQAVEQGGEPRWAQRRIDAWFKLPRIFEVSRTGAFDFSATPSTAASATPAALPSLAALAAPVAPATATAQPGECRRRSLEGCTSIHPPGSAMVPALGPAARLLLGALLLATLTLPVWVLSRATRRRVRRFVAPDGPGRVFSRGGRIALLVAAVLGLVLALPLAFAWAWPSLAAAMTAHGKPLTLSEGISPWPTYALRLVGLLACVVFILYAWSKLAANRDTLALHMRLGATRRLLEEDLREMDRNLSPAQRLAAMLSVRFFRDRPSPRDKAPVMSAGARSFWKHYIVQDRSGARAVRTTLCVLAMTLAGALVDVAMGDPPVAPQRGPLTQAMQAWSTMPATVAAQFLIFFVADAALLSVLFMRGLRLHSSSWPARTLELFRQRSGVPEAHLDDWIDLSFIARRTRCIGTLIYYPFIVLSLMLLARSAFFDDWYSSPSHVVLSTVSFAIVLACAFALRREAENSRRHALQRVRDSLLHAHGAHGADGADGADMVRRLGVLQQRIETLREGAFAPYTQQPLLRAVLMPLLTVGGASLWDYLSLANL